MTDDDRDALLEALHDLVRRRGPTPVADLRDALDALGWSSDRAGAAIEEAVLAGDIARAGARLDLTPPAAAHAARRARARSATRFDRTFARVEDSATYGRFCEQVYGVDLRQFNMVYPAQLDALIARTALKPGGALLDMGCGPGRITAHLSERTGAAALGVDFASQTIARAAARAADRADRLAFEVGDLDTFDPGERRFDVVLFMDTIYFVADQVETLRRARRWLRPGGCVAVFYTQVLPEGGDRNTLRIDQSPLAIALTEAGLDFDAVDFTTDERAHWPRVRAVAEALEADFVAEGHPELARSRLSESARLLPAVEDDRIARHLVIARPR